MVTFPKSINGINSPHLTFLCRQVRHPRVLRARTSKNLRSSSLTGTVRLLLPITSVLGAMAVDIYQEAYRPRDHSPGPYIHKRRRLRQCRNGQGHSDCIRPRGPSQMFRRPLLLLVRAVVEPRIQLPKKQWSCESLQADRTCAADLSVCLA